ncbi:MAG: hypothetical protein R6X02_25535 [Enhygromyxa sp.]
MIAMPRTVSGFSSSALALAAAFACGRPQPDDAKAVVAESSSDPTAATSSAGARPRAPKRAAPAMPETFAAFSRPDLAALDGVWLLDAQAPIPRILWIIEDQGSVLTTIDRHGRETAFDVTLISPCALRLTDDHGNAQTRSIALTDQRLIVTSKGAVAVEAPDGSLLACVGHRTYQIAADGRCRYTTETLGTWSDPIEAESACELATVDGARVLTVAGQSLREHDGIWLDELAAAGVARRVEDRAAGLAALVPGATEALIEAGGETG